MHQKSSEKKKKRNESKRNLQTKAKIETVIAITPTLLLRRKIIINIIKRHLNLIMTKLEITKFPREIL